MFKSFLRRSVLAMPSSLKELRSSGWQSISVKEELRRNLVESIRAGKPFDYGVHGYDTTVIPQLENALLAGHDVIFLGERGQAKSRLIRCLVQLLDEWIPIIAGSEINDDPYNPVSLYARNLISEHGEDTPIHWVHRDERYGEKLATPDTSIADVAVSFIEYPNLPAPYKPPSASFAVFVVPNTLDAFVCCDVCAVPYLNSR